MAIKLSFMTFVCPEWKIEKIVRFARESGYDGVEIRVDIGHKHEISSKSSKEQRNYIKKLFSDEGVNVSCIATSVQFGFADPEKRRENIESAKENIILASDLGAKVIRIFAGGGIPRLTEEAATYIADAFTEVGDFGMDYNVCPLLESGHDIIKTAVEAAEVAKRVETSNFGINWNHSDLDEPAFKLLKKYLRHFHLHEEVLPWQRFSCKEILKNFPNDNRNVLNLAKKLKSIDFDGYISLEIMAKRYNCDSLPEELLIETAKRLKSYIAQA